MAQADSILNIVHNTLTQQDWSFTTDEGKGFIRASIGGNHSSFNIIFDAREDKNQLFLYVLCPTKVPPLIRTKAAEFQCRANWGLAIGNFEMNMNDGEVRYKVSIDVEDGTLSEEMVKNMIAAGVATMDRYYPGFMSLCFGGKDAAAAITMIEGGNGGDGDRELGRGQ